MITDSDIISRYLLIITPFISLVFIYFFVILRRRRNIAIILIFVLIFIQSLTLYFYNVKPHTDNFEKGVNECYINIGKWFSENTNENSKIILNDVGTIGYFSDRYIIDAGALINRDLNLNKSIMGTSMIERDKASNVLRFTVADYLVQRDTIEDPLKNLNNGQYKLEYLFSREFPGLGISDPTIKYYNIYHIVK